MYIFHEKCFMKIFPKLLNRNFDETDAGFTLELIMQMQMQKYAEQISEVSNKATMELNIENVTVLRLFYF